MKNIGKKVLPRSWIFLYHSTRAAWKLGLLMPLFLTLRNARKKVRLGDRGGWTIPREFLNEHSICYCVGCGEDITFDLELIRKYSCAVFAFDPTPRSIAHVAKHAAHLANYRLSEFAIWDREEVVKFYAPRKKTRVSHSITNLDGTEDYFEVPTKTLKQVFDENGHTAITLLKMDIEGAEHAVIRTIVENNLPIEVLCVEFDELAGITPERVARIRRSIQSLLDFGYHYFWIEGPNFTFVRTTPT